MNLLLSPIQCILWIIVGGVAGSLAHQVAGGRSGGFVADVVLGLIGAVIGGFVLGLFGVDFGGGSNLSPLSCCANIIVATFGAALLIVIGRVLSGNRAV
ncbi:MAG: GlsB/YeaQ/YmgE family stress response membrane protein [Anaerolineae bacterium]|nr:GlsB/YeaQ/YmgE family stress response membrane protein [Anaerolineae bacterium]